MPTGVYVRTREVTNETRKKISEANKGEKNHFYGKKHTVENCRKMSEAMVGNKNCASHKYDEAFRKKISEANKGKKLSEGAKKKIGEFHKGNKYNVGKKASEETKRKMSEAMKGLRLGIKLSDEHRRKLSESHKGYKMPDEQKRKISEANRKNRSKDEIKLLREKQKEYMKEYMKMYYKTEKYKEYKNSEEHKEYRRKYENNKKKTCPQYKLSKLLRNRILMIIKQNQRGGSAIKDLGCTLDELKVYIEDRFVEGMTWSNWTKNGWHIDHIIPLSSFDLTDREQFLKACHYTNLQPLWALDNHKKSNKIL